MYVEAGWGVGWVEAGKQMKKLQHVEGFECQA